MTARLRPTRLEHVVDGHKLRAQLTAAWQAGGTAAEQRQRAIEVLKAAAGITDSHSPDDARAKIGKLLEGPDAALVVERLSALMGLTRATPGVQETFWAVRKLFGKLATHRPLVVVFDDIHWAEPTFLDLLEYLADSLDGVPAFFLCLARPELLEVRAGWMTSKANASLITSNRERARALFDEAEMIGAYARLYGEAMGRPGILG